MEAARLRRRLRVSLTRTILTLIRNQNFLKLDKRKIKRARVRRRTPHPPQVVQPGHVMGRNRRK
jgi:hypothetical protein